MCIRDRGLTEQTAQKAQEAAVLGKKLERYQKQQVAIQKVDAIEALSLIHISPKMLPSLLQSSAFSEIIVALLLSYISDFYIYFSFSCVKPISTFQNKRFFIQ